jgi:hypothetical protein
MLWMTRRLMAGILYTQHLKKQNPTTGESPKRLEHQIVMQGLGLLELDLVVLELTLSHQGQRSSLNTRKLISL